MIPHVLRLKPGQDLKKELHQCAQNFNAGFVIGCCGSLSKLRIRPAQSSNSFEKNENFEIISLQGSLAKDGVHLHISVSDNSCQTYGGHLLDGCLISTTAEILVIELNDYIFSRKLDPGTSYKELCIKKAIT
jgi:uncharacterized protein